MTFTLLPPLGQHSPRPAFWLCMVVLLLWSTSLVSAQAEYRRVYKMRDIRNNRLKDMADGMKRCAGWVGGELAIVDTLEKELEIEYAVDLHRTENNITGEVRAMLGGSVTDKGCVRNTAHLPGHCFWCWDYGTGNCGANNESLILIGLSPNFTKFPGRFEYFESGHPFNGSPYPYIHYSNGARKWRPARAYHGTDLLCVVKEPFADSHESSNPMNVPLREPTAAVTGFTEWWIPLVIVVGLLVVAVIAFSIIFCCCCGAGAPLEERNTLEDDDCLSSVRNTQSNRSLVSRGVSMCSMGSRGSSVYSASQVFSQDDVECCDWNNDERVCRGHSTASYYY